MNYCTVEEVKQALGNMVTQTNDGVLLDIVESITSEIDAYCNRSFAAATATRYFDGKSDHIIIDDLVTLTTFKLDTDGNGTWETTLTENTDFLLYPYNTTPKWRVDLSCGSSRSDFCPGIPKAVQIAGSWGYAAAVPAPIKQAAIMQVVRRFRQSQAGYGTEIGTPDVGTTTVFQGLSSDVKRILQPYVRPFYG